MAFEKQKRVQEVSVTFALKILSKIIASRELASSDQILNKELLKKILSR